MQFVFQKSLSKAIFERNLVHMKKEKKKKALEKKKKNAAALE
jgi:hypothetical protein